jgi:hypothetical protein
MVGLSAARACDYGAGSCTPLREEGVLLCEGAQALHYLYLYAVLQQDVD